MPRDRPVAQGGIAQVRAAPVERRFHLDDASAAHQHFDDSSPYDLALMIRWQSRIVLKATREWSRVLPPLAQAIHKPAQLMKRALFDETNEK